MSNSAHLAPGDPPYTLLDLRVFVVYCDAAARFEVRRQQVMKPVYSSSSEAHTMSIWQHLGTPTPGRITRAIAPTLSVFRRLRQVALTVYRELDPTAFDCVTAEILQTRHRDLTTAGSLTLDEFEQLWDEPEEREPRRSKTKPSPERRRLEALYERLRQLYRNGTKEAEILAHLESPAGKDLTVEVSWALMLRPTKKSRMGGSPKRRTPRDVVQAALAKIFRSAESK